MPHRFVIKGMFAKEKQPPRMTVDEKRLFRQMAFEQGLRPAEIAVNVGRKKLARSWLDPKVGRLITYILVKNFL